MIDRGKQLAKAQSRVSYGRLRESGRSRRLFEAEQKVIAPGQQRISLLSELAISHGSGATVTDLDGNVYIDFFAGVGVASLGHAHPRYVQTVEAQLRKITVGSFASESRLRLLSLIAEVAPGPLRRTQLYSGGSEAVEAAIRLAKSYTGNFEVVGFWGGFHGKTGGVMALIGDESKQGWGPLPPGQYSIPYADCYRCPFGTTYPGCGMFCLDFARRAIKTTTSGAVAAILVEPMQGTAGNVIPPPEFLPGVKEIAREIGALVIADEMITGFGRTGKMFGCEHTGVIPDIMTVGKGMGSGFPISGLISTDEIVEAKPFARPSASSSSYGGNPLAAAAALATIETIIEEKLVENSRRVGEVLLSGLKRLQDKYEFIGDVRGCGLLLGVDLVRDRRTKEPLSRQATEAIFKEALRRGLLVMGYFPRMRINPPLTLTPEQAQEGVAILEEAFACVEREGGLG